jgi:hypothetical protein
MRSGRSADLGGGVGYAVGWLPGIDDVARLRRGV